MAVAVAVAVVVVVVVVVVGDIAVDVSPVDVWIVVVVEVVGEADEDRRWWSWSPRSQRMCTQATTSQ